MNTKPSIIVKYPPTHGGGTRYSTIRNDPESIWSYIHAIAPALYIEAGQCKKLAGRNGWQYDEARVRAACLLIIEGKVKCHPHDAEPLIRWHVPFCVCQWHYEVAQVDGYSVRALGPGPRAKLYCTCHDASAPKSRAAEYTCKHIIAWALAPEEEK